MHEELGEGTLRTADQNWPKGHSLSYGLMLSNKNWGKGGGGRGDIWSDGHCIPKESLHVLSPAFLGVSEHFICLLMRSIELIPYFFLLACVIFALPGKLSLLSQPTSLYNPSLSHLGRVSEQFCDAELLPGLNHNTKCVLN